MVWFTQSSGTSQTLYSVSFIGSNNGTIVGTGGTILHTTNGGMTWVPQLSGTNNDLKHVSFSDINTGIAVGNSGTILYTTDGGITWTKKTSTNIDFNSTKFASATIISTNTIFAIGNVPWNGNIYRTTDNGINWTLQQQIPINGSSGAITGISFSDSNTGVVLTWSSFTSQLNSSIYRTIDGGLSWNRWGDITLASITYGHILYDIACPSPNNVIAVGEKGLIIQTTDGGSTWKVHSTGTTEHLFGISLIANTGTAVGTHGTIIHTKSIGVTSISEEGLSKLPNHFSLEQNYPNPFNPSTSIRFELLSRSFVTLKVYDMVGREVVTLIHGMQEAGSHKVSFNASGNPSGIYFYRMTTDKYTETKKLILIQ
jgi:photosystem II stability/assembly factor-like uncharacterized protein